MGFIRTVCAVLMIGLALACSSPAQRFVRDLETASHKVASGEQLNLAEVNSAQWDRVVVFPPYTPLKRVEAVTMMKCPPNVKRARLDMRDDINLLMFLRGQQLQLAVLVPRAVADFSAPGEPILRDDALFTKQAGNAFVHR